MHQEARRLERDVRFAASRGDPVTDGLDAVRRIGATATRHVLEQDPQDVGQPVECVAGRRPQINDAESPTAGDQL